MAYRRSIITRAKHFYQEERFASSFTCINHCNKDDEQRSNPGCAPEGTKIATFLQNNRHFTSGGVNRFGGSRRLLQDPRFSFVSQQFTGSMNHGLSFSRNISSTVGDDGEGAVDVLADGSVEAVAAASQVAAPAVNEVAVAAADSFLPVALLQYFIDGIHTLTGLNWWASIALATVFIRFATLPLMISQLKNMSKLTLLRPRLEEIVEEARNRDMSPSEGEQRMQQLFKEQGVTPLTPLKGLLFQGPIFVSIFVAINNMVEKVPSFKEGGALWFTDLTTPDSMYILPVLTALTFLITVECKMQGGMEGNPAAAILKIGSRVFAVATVPFTGDFAKGIFCYLITFNLFSLMYGLVIKRPEVKKRLGIPIIPVIPTPAGEQKPGFSFFDAIKKYAEAQLQQAISSSSTEESPKPAATQQRISSSSILSQRIRTLEKKS